MCKTWLNARLCGAIPHHIPFLAEVSGLSIIQVIYILQT